MINTAKSQRPKLWLLVAFVAIAALIRVFLSEVPNIAPITAMALFGGAYFSSRKTGIAILLAVMLISDLVLEAAFQLGWRQFGGIHSGMPFVYVAFLIIVLFGTKLKNRIKLLPLVGAGVLSSILFFIVSNFGVWLTSGIYPVDVSGLIACYVAAIPFFHYTVLGDLFFIGVFFGGMELVKYKFPRLALAH